MRIAYLCQYFPPEMGAPSARVSEMSAAWAAQGHQVTVITGLPNHPSGRIPPGYAGTIFRKERVGDVDVWRNWIYATPNEGIIKKTFSHLSFMVSSALLSTPRLRGHDVVIVSSPTFFCVLTAWFMSRVWRVPFVFEVRDLWPGIFIELGVLKNRALIGILEAMELWLYRRAAQVVVVTDSFAENLRGRGIPGSKITTITNGVDGEFFAPAASDNDVRRVLAGADQFVVLYIGAHGISHALHAVLDAAALTRDDPGIRWAFVGEGAEKKTLLGAAQSRNLTNVHFFEGQPKNLMPDWYAACDAALVPLKNIPMFESFIPSKMFEIMACGRPIVASVKGEARTILERSGAAIIVDPEDAAGIAAGVRRLKGDAALRRQLSQAGRQFVVSHYDRKELARRYVSMLERIAGRPVQDRP